MHDLFVRLASMPASKLSDIKVGVTDFIKAAVFFATLGMAWSNLSGNQIALRKDVDNFQRDYVRRDLADQQAQAFREFLAALSKRLDKFEDKIDLLIETQITKDKK